MRLSIRSVAAAGVVAVITMAGQAAASAAAAAPTATAATAAPNVVALPDGGPGHWSQVSAQTQITAEAGLVRGADGVLHVLWEDGTVNGHEGILDTPIAADGAVGHSTVVISGQSDVSSPDATATHGGLDAFWNDTTNGNTEGIFEATRPVKGGHWSPGKLVASESAQSSAVTAATASNGVPWVAFTYSFGLSLVHLGQRQDNVPELCCIYYPGIGTDGVTGTSYAAWMSLITQAEGIWVHRLSNTGVTGKVFRLPNSVTDGNIVPYSQRVGITGRGHGRPGVYVSYGVGYPSATALDVYRIGASKPFTIAKFSEFGDHLANSTITAGPNGRLWEVWVDGLGGTTSALSVRASNTAATAWSPTAVVPLPRGTQTIWRAYANAQAGKVDVVALMTVSGRTAFYATQVPFPVAKKALAKKALAAVARPAAPQSLRVAKTVTNDRLGAASDGLGGRHKPGNPNAGLGAVILAY